MAGIGGCELDDYWAILLGMILGEHLEVAVSRDWTGCEFLGNDHWRVGYLAAVVEYSFSEWEAGVAYHWG